MKEYYYEKLLHIKTTGEQQGFNKSLQYHRYEPTPYIALEELLSNYELKSTDRIVDFGCGKGRLNFYFHYRCDASVLGVEMNEKYYQNALDNQKRYCSKTKKCENKVQFYCGKAEEYSVTSADNRFYFFNPFSVEIFRSVVANILQSYEAFPRGIELILYYPAYDYLYYLENYSPFEQVAEIKVSQLYELDPYERFLIYRMGQ